MCSFLTFHSLLFYSSPQSGLFKGLPFLFGVIPVLLALMVALCIKEKGPLLKRHSHDSIQLT